MAIKILRNKLNEAGKIKIGKRGEEVESADGKKFDRPVRLDHFVLVTTEKDEKGHFVSDTALMDRLQMDLNAMVDKNGKLIGIPIRMLYQDDELNFATRLASYVSGKLNCHGDGEVAHKRLDNFEKEHACPCSRFAPDYTGKDKCKPNGTLTCVIDQANLFGQVHKFRTTSINSVAGIIGGIHLIKTATGGRIAGLPLMLTVTSKTTTIPGSGAATTIQVVSLCYRGSMMDLRQKTLEFVTEEKQYLLGMDQIEKQAKQDGAGVVVSPDEETDHVREFYPDAADDIIDVTPTDASVEKAEQEPVHEEVLAEKDLKEKKQNELVKRLNAAKDPGEAIKIMRRLVSAHLVAWTRKTFVKEPLLDDKATKAAWVGQAERLIKEQWPMVDIEEDSEMTKAVHPELMKMAKIEKQIDLAKHMTERFKGIPINRTLPIPDLLKLAEKLLAEEKLVPENEEVVGPKETIVDPEDEFVDDGTPIDRDHLMQIRELKTSGKEHGMTDDMFFNSVKVLGVESATKLTNAQGDKLIASMQKFIVDHGGVPF